MYGMTGGFGWFLLQTSFEVCTGIVISETNTVDLIPKLNRNRLLTKLSLFLFALICNASFRYISALHSLAQLVVIVFYEGVLRFASRHKVYGELAVSLLILLLPVAFHTLLAVIGLSTETVANR